MDEVPTRATLAKFKFQLSLVKEAVGNTADETVKAELEKLRDDLVTLISLTEHIIQKSTSEMSNHSTMASEVTQPACASTTVGQAPLTSACRNAASESESAERDDQCLRGVAGTSSDSSRSTVTPQTQSVSVGQTAVVKKELPTVAVHTSAGGEGLTVNRTQVSAVTERANQTAVVRETKPAAVAGSASACGSTRVKESPTSVIAGTSETIENVSAKQAPTVPAAAAAACKNGPTTGKQTRPIILRWSRGTSSNVARASAKRNTAVKRPLHGPPTSSNSSSTSERTPVKRPSFEKRTSARNTPPSGTRPVSAQNAFSTRQPPRRGWRGQRSRGLQRTDRGHHRLPPADFDLERGDEWSRRPESPPPSDQRRSYHEPEQMLDDCRPYDRRGRVDVVDYPDEYFDDGTDNNDAFVCPIEECGALAPSLRSIHSHLVLFHHMQERHTRTVNIYRLSDRSSSAAAEQRHCSRERSESLIDFDPRTSAQPSSNYRFRQSLERGRSISGRGRQRPSRTRYSRR